MWIFKDVQTTLRLTRQPHGHTSNCKNQTLVFRLLGVVITVMAEATRPVRA